MRWRAEDVVDRLRATYQVGDGTTGSRWSLLTEVAVLGRRIDVLLHDRVNGHRVAFEVKVTRADFRSETDEKRAAAETVANLCYYVTPPGLLPLDTILPPRWGLMEVGHGDHEHVIATPRTDLAAPADAALLAHVLARASDDAEAIRTAPQHDQIRLRRRVEDLEGQVDRAWAAVRREHDRVTLAMSMLLATEGYQDCSACTTAIYWRPAPAVWVHRDTAQHERCAKARAEAARIAQEARTGSRYTAVAPGPVLPVALAAVEVPARR